MVCEPKRVYGPPVQVNFLGLSVVDFQMSVGWNEQTSSLSVNLIADPCDGPRLWRDANGNRQSGVRSDPGWVNPEPGTPVIFRWEADPYADSEDSRGGVEFAGLVQSYTKTNGADGLDRYNVQIVDPRQLLEGTQVIVNKYQGSIGNTPNVINAYGQIDSEANGITCPDAPGGRIGGYSFANAGAYRVNENGMIWNDVKAAIQGISSRTVAGDTGGRINFIDGSAGEGVLAPSINGGGYIIDLDDIPFAPSYYRVSGPNLSVMDLVSQVCQDAGCDYTVSLLPTQGSNIIKVRTVDRTTAPIFGAIDDFIVAQSGAGYLISSTAGQEMRMDTTSALLIGGDERLPLESTSATMIPFWGLDTNGDMIQASISAGEYQVRLDIRRLNASLNTSFASSYIWVSESELRAALGDIDAWKHISIAKGLGVATHLATINQTKFIDAEKIEKVADGTLPSHSLAVPNIGDDRDPNNNNAKDFTKIYDFIRSYADEFYGKQFLASTSFICVVGDREANSFRTSHEPSTDGCWVSDSTNTIIGLTHKSAASDFFRTEDGRYQTILRYPATGGSSMGGLGGSYLSDPSQLGDDNYITNGSYIWVKADIDPKLYYGYPTNTADTTPAVLIKVGAPVINQSSDASNPAQGVDQPQGGADFLSKQAGGAGLGTPNWIDRSAFSLSMLPIAIAPDASLVPLVSRVTSYGPWGSAGVSSQTLVTYDEGFVPWEFGSDTLMGVAGLDKVNQVASQMTKAERGSVTVAGFPQYGLGNELGTAAAGSDFMAGRTPSYTQVTPSLVATTVNMGTIPNGSLITNVSASIGPQGYTTEYQLSTYTPRYGRFAKDNADRLKKIGRNRLDANRNSRALSMIPQKITQAFARLRQKISTQIGQSSRAPKSANHTFIGRFAGGRNEAFTMNIKEASMTFPTDDAYSSSAMMSVDGIMRPVSKAGDGGLTPYVTHTDSTSSGNVSFSIAPDGPRTDYSGQKINQEYLDPLSNPGVNVSERDTAGSGHDIEILARNATPPQSGWAIADGDASSEGYANDYRFFAMRGPIMLQGWGYDLAGKPVPNAADSAASASGGVFVESNLEDNFLPAFLKQPKTWPVAPLDLRLDRKRGVWTVPPQPRNLHVTPSGDTCLSDGDSYVVNINNGQTVFKGDGTEATEKAQIYWPWDIKSPSGVGKIPVYYDTNDAKYYAFPTNRFDTTLSGSARQNDVKHIIFGSAFSGTYSTGTCDKTLTIDATAGNFSANTGWHSGVPVTGCLEELPTQQTSCSTVSCLNFGSGLSYSVDGGVGSLNATNFIYQLKYPCASTGVATTGDCINVTSLGIGSGLGLINNNSGNAVIYTELNVTGNGYLPCVDPTSSSPISSAGANIAGSGKSIKFGGWLESSYDSDTCVFSVDGITPKIGVQQAANCNTGLGTEILVQTIKLGTGLRQVTPGDCTTTISTNIKASGKNVPYCDVSAGTAVGYKLFDKIEFIGGLSSTFGRKGDSCEFTVSGINSIEVGVTGSCDASGISYNLGDAVTTKQLWFGTGLWAESVVGGHPCQQVIRLNNYVKGISNIVYNQYNDPYNSTDGWNYAGRDTPITGIEFRRGMITTFSGDCQGRGSVVVESPWYVSGEDPCVGYDWPWTRAYDEVTISTGLVFGTGIQLSTHNVGNQKRVRKVDVAIFATGSMPYKNPDNTWDWSQQTNKIVKPIQMIEFKGGLGLSVTAGGCHLIVSGREGLDIGNSGHCSGVTWRTGPSNISDLYAMSGIYIEGNRLRFNNFVEGIDQNSFQQIEPYSDSNFASYKETYSPVTGLQFKRGMFIRATGCSYADIIVESPQYISGYDVCQDPDLPWTRSSDASDIYSGLILGTGLQIVTQSDIRRKRIDVGIFVTGSMPVKNGDGSWDYDTREGNFIAPVQKIAFTGGIGLSRTDGGCTILVSGAVPTGGGGGGLTVYKTGICGNANETEYDLNKLAIGSGLFLDTFNAKTGILHLNMKVDGWEAENRCARSYVSGTTYQITGITFGTGLITSYRDCGNVQVDSKFFVSGDGSQCLRNIYEDGMHVTGIVFGNGLKVTNTSSPTGCQSYVKTNIYVSGSSDETNIDIKTVDWNTIQFTGNLRTTHDEDTCKVVVSGFQQPQYITVTGLASCSRPNYFKDTTVNQLGFRNGLSVEDDGAGNPVVDSIFYVEGTTDTVGCGKNYTAESVTGIRFGNGLELAAGDTNECNIVVRSKFGVVGETLTDCGDTTASVAEAYITGLDFRNGLSLTTDGCNAIISGTPNFRVGGIAGTCGGTDVDHRVVSGIQFGTGLLLSNPDSCDATVNLNFKAGGDTSECFTSVSVTENITGLTFGTGLKVGADGCNLHVNSRFLISGWNGDCARGVNTAPAHSTGIIFGRGLYVVNGISPCQSVVQTNIYASGASTVNGGFDIKTRTWDTIQATGTIRIKEDAAGCKILLSGIDTSALTIYETGVCGASNGTENEVTKIAYGSGLSVDFRNNATGIVKLDFKVEGYDSECFVGGSRDAYNVTGITFGSGLKTSYDGCGNMHVNSRFFMSGDGGVCRGTYYGGAQTTGINIGGGLKLSAGVDGCSPVLESNIFASGSELLGGALQKLPFNAIQYTGSLTVKDLGDGCTVQVSGVDQSVTVTGSSDPCTLGADVSTDALNSLTFSSGLKTVITALGDVSVSAPFSVSGDGGVCRGTYLAQSTTTGLVIGKGLKATEDVSCQTVIESNIFASGGATLGGALQKLPFNAVQFTGNLVVTDEGDGCTVTVSGVDRKVAVTGSSDPCALGGDLTLEDVAGFTFSSGLKTIVSADGVSVSAPFSVSGVDTCRGTYFSQATTTGLVFGKGLKASEDASCQTLVEFNVAASGGPGSSKLQGWDGIEFTGNLNVSSIDGCTLRVSGSYPTITGSTDPCALGADTVLEAGGIVFSSGLKTIEIDGGVSVSAPFSVSGDGGVCRGTHLSQSITTGLIFGKGLKAVENASCQTVVESNIFASGAAALGGALQKLPFNAVQFTGNLTVTNEGDGCTVTVSGVDTTITATGSSSPCALGEDVVVETLNGIKFGSGMITTDDGAGGITVDAPFYVSGDGGSCRGTYYSQANTSGLVLGGGLVATEDVSCATLIETRLFASGAETLGGAVAKLPFTNAIQYTGSLVVKQIDDCTVQVSGVNSAAIAITGSTDPCTPASDIVVDPVGGIVFGTGLKTTEDGTGGVHVNSRFYVSGDGGVCGGTYANGQITSGIVIGGGLKATNSSCVSTLELNFLAQQSGACGAGAGASSAINKMVYGTGLSFSANGCTGILQSNITADGSTYASPCAVGSRSNTFTNKRFQNIQFAGYLNSAINGCDLIVSGGKSPINMGSEGSLFESIALVAGDNVTITSSGSCTGVISVSPISVTGSSDPCALGNDVTADAQGIVFSSGLKTTAIDGGVSVSAPFSLSGDGGACRGTYFSQATTTGLVLGAGLKATENASCQTLIETNIFASGSTTRGGSLQKLPFNSIIFDSKFLGLTAVGDGCTVSVSGLSIPATGSSDPCNPANDTTTNALDGLVFGTGLKTTKVGNSLHVNSPFYVSGDGSVCGGTYAGGAVVSGIKVGAGLKATNSACLSSIELNFNAGQGAKCGAGGGSLGQVNALTFGTGLNYTADGCTGVIISDIKANGSEFSDPCSVGSRTNAFSNKRFENITFNGYLASVIDGCNITVSGRKTPINAGDSEAALSEVINILAGSGVSITSSGSCSAVINATAGNITVTGSSDPCNPAGDVSAGSVDAIVFGTGLTTIADGNTVYVNSALTAAGRSITNECAVPPEEGASFDGKFTNLTFTGYLSATQTDCDIVVEGVRSPLTLTKSGTFCGTASNASGNVTSINLASGLDLTVNGCSATISSNIKVAGAAACGRSAVNPEVFQTLEFGSGLSVNQKAGEDCTWQINSAFSVEGRENCGYVGTITANGVESLVFGEGLTMTDDGSCQVTVSAGKYVGGAGSNGCRGGTAAPTEFSTLLFSGLGLSTDGCTGTISGPTMRIEQEAFCSTPAISPFAYESLTLSTGLRLEPSSCGATLMGGIKVSYYDAVCNGGALSPRPAFTGFVIGRGLNTNNVSDCVFSIDAGLSGVRDGSNIRGQSVNCDVGSPTLTASSCATDGDSIQPNRGIPQFLRGIYTGPGIGATIGSSNTCDDDTLILFANNCVSGLNNACEEQIGVQVYTTKYSNAFCVNGTAGLDQSTAGSVDGSQFSKGTALYMNEGGGSWGCTVVTGIEVTKNGAYVTDVVALNGNIGGTSTCPATGPVAETRKFWLTTVPCP